MSSFRNVHWLWLTAVVMLVDQVTKQLVVKHMALFETVPLMPHLNLTSLRNTGAAFSMFSDSSPIVFVLIGVAVSIGILMWMRRNPQGQTRVAIALALIMGGALGNVIDRVTRGHVVDFVDFYWGTWHFAAFNVADAAISIGAALMVLDSLIESLRSSSAPKAGA
ncbi:signal peptidase II [Hydrocarboniphaga daqingensis]|uniref:Lipoprotein signal peptidase n=1 Tax=Hydrocarboniphaga daqingensis TaxID=490188 RepID=A0A1M5N360_9GAMM|nr:signal peptidase II [Hydrocarboniphaga daqingensis]SHG84000.1 signal peptidase II [Hydrocarboniphaga daqingensis]